MNPQHIVYLGIILVGVGVSISAIDPLKKEPISESLSSDWFAVGIGYNMTGLSSGQYFQHYYNDDGRRYSCISEVELTVDECEAQHFQKVDEK